MSRERILIEDFLRKQKSFRILFERNRNRRKRSRLWFNLMAAIHDEEPQRAIKLFSAAEVLRERINSPMTDYERVEYNQSVPQLRAMLSEAEFNALWAEGRAMMMEQAIELALTNTSAE